MSMVHSKAVITNPHEAHLFGFGVQLLTKLVGDGSHFIQLLASHFTDKLSFLVKFTNDKT